MILFIFVMNSSHRVWTEIAEYFADRKVSMEAVKGMMELAKFKSDVISWKDGERKLHCGYKFVEAVKGMTELAKFKSNVNSWNGRT